MVVRDLAACGRNPRGQRVVRGWGSAADDLLAARDLADRLHELADVAVLKQAMRTACVHRRRAASATDREPRLRLRVDAGEEALVDVDAVLARGPRDDDREAVAPLVDEQPALAERQLELPT